MAVLAADGFEPEELQRPVKRLRSEGALVSLVSPQAGRIRGMHLLERGKPHRVDHTLERARARDYDALLLPGGHLNPDLLRQNERALSFVSEFDRHGKPIAALSRAPSVLISAGLAPGRKLTSAASIRDDVRNAGAVWVDSALVRDSNWLSSRGPEDLPAFNDAMISLFSDRSSRTARRARARRPTRQNWTAWVATAALLTTAVYATTRR